MINFGALSILLIHRELLSEAKGLINTVHDGVSRLLPMWVDFKGSLKENGKIKGGSSNILKHSNRSIDWRLSGKSFVKNINPRKVARS